MKHIRPKLLALCAALLPPATAVVSVIVVGSLQASNPAQAKFSEAWDKFFEKHPNLSALKDALANIATKDIPDAGLTNAIIQLSDNLKAELAYLIKERKGEAVQKALDTGDWKEHDSLEALESCLNGNCDEWKRVQQGKPLSSPPHPPQPAVTPPTPGPVVTLPPTTVGPTPPPTPPPGPPPGPVVTLPPTVGPPPTPPPGPPPTPGPGTVTPPPTPGPVTVTAVPGPKGGLTCYYKDGKQSWSFTTYDPTIKTCPPIFGRPPSGSAAAGPPPVMLQDPTPPMITGLGGMGIIPGNRPPPSLPPTVINTPPNVTPPNVTPPTKHPAAGRTCEQNGGYIFSCRQGPGRTAKGWPPVTNVCNDPNVHSFEGSKADCERNGGKVLSSPPNTPRRTVTGRHVDILPVEPLPPPPMTHTPAPLPALVLQPPQIASIPQAPDHVQAQPQPKKPKKKAKPHEPQPKKYVNRYDPQAAAREAAVANALIGIAIGVARGGLRSGNRGGGGGGHRPAPSGQHR